MKSVRRQALGLVLAFLVMLAYFSPMQQTLRSLPPTLALTEGQIHSLRLGAPLRLTRETGTLAVLSSGDETLGTRTVSLEAQSAGKSELMLSFMGLVPIRRVEVAVSGEKRLIPGGQAIGVAMRTDGVLVVGTSGLGNEESPAALSGIRAGDVLRKVNGVTVTSAAQLTELIGLNGMRPPPWSTAGTA